ncbi:MAG: hypothetical protein HRU26_14675 [Psychroserpens sp.]|nr:hypothetical protein [Psychroserpens sp.]
MTTTLDNNGNINLTTSGDIFISTNAILNNNATGVIDFQGDDSGFTGSGAAPRNIFNLGLIKTSYADPTDKSSIGVELINNGGTLQVEVGTLNLTSSQIELNGGTLNVFTDAALDWDSGITLTGELTGELNGPINWRSTVIADVGQTPTFNFTGNAPVTWVSGT